VVSQYWGLREETDYQLAALQAADRALALDPSLSLAYAVRGEAQSNRIALGEAGSWDLSMTNLDEAIARDPRNATAYLWRAENLVSLGYLDRATETLESCLALDPAYEICRRNLALVDLFAGRTERALRLYEAGLEQGYVNADVYFAPAVAARGDRVGTLGVLLQQYRDKPPLLQALFRVLTDPSFGAADRREALALVDPTHDNQEGAIGALWLLHSYDAIVSVVTDFPGILWARSDPEWVRSQARKRMIERWRLPEYWRAHGFPPQCRAVASADFSCP